MLTIVGDVIEYDGKPFAIITAPLSGWRLDAIDCVNNHDLFLDGVVEELAEEKACDFRNDAIKIIDSAVETLWLSPEIADHLRDEISGIGALE